MNQEPKGRATGYLRASILTTGNELLLGRTLNTHAMNLAREMTNWGFQVAEQRTTTDDKKEIQKAIWECAQKSDLLLVTGGLGPTPDDLTREALSELLEKPLLIHPPAQEWIRSFYQQRNVELREEMLKQAKVPKGSRPLENPKGAACGFAVLVDGCWVIVLPGVASEMEAMLDQKVQPLIQELFPNLPAKSLNVLTCRLLGITESEAVMFGKLWKQRLDEEKKDSHLHWGVQIRFPEVHLLFYALKNEAKEYFDRIRDWAKKETRDHLVDFEPTPLEQLIHDLFLKKELTLATAESCTGGYLGSRLLALPGASAYFLGGVITYSNLSKMQLIGVSSATLKEHGAVSRECALEMAEGVRRQHQADVGAAITGILGPSGGNYDKPVGTAYVAVKAAEHELIEQFQFTRSRLLNREELVCKTLLLTRRMGTMLS